MTTARRIFVDTNVLTRATIDAAPLHTEARTLLDQLWDKDAELYISHQVIREYIANATRPQTYSPALPVDGVLEQVEDFRKSFHILPDSPTILSKLLELVRTVPVGGKQIHDANITDFERYLAYIRMIPLVEDTL